MTASDRSGGDREGGRPTSKSHDPQSNALENPTASRATLARRLRAVERALTGTEGTDDVAFETAAEGTVDPDELDAIADRLDTLGRAVRTIGECLVARDRTRRREAGTESVRRAVESLADTEAGTPIPDDSVETGTVGAEEADTDDPATDSGGVERSVESDRGLAPIEESPAEWLDRAAAGGVAPPPVE